MIYLCYKLIISLQQQFPRPHIITSLLRRFILVRRFIKITFRIIVFFLPFIPYKGYLGLAFRAFFLFVLFGFFLGFLHSNHSISTVLNLWRLKFVYPCYGLFVLACVTIFLSIHEAYRQSHYLQNMWDLIFTIVFKYVNIDLIKNQPMLSIAITMFLGCTLLLQSSRLRPFEEWNPYSLHELGLSSHAFLPTLFLMMGVLYGMVSGLYRFSFVLTIAMFTFQMTILAYLHTMSEEHLRVLIVMLTVENANNYYYLSTPDTTEQTVKLAYYDAYTSINRLLQQNYLGSDKESPMLYCGNYLDILTVLYKRFSRNNSKTDYYALCVGLASIPIQSMDDKLNIFQRKYFTNLMSSLGKKCEEIKKNNHFHKPYIEPFLIENNELRFYVMVMIGVILRYSYEHKQAEPVKQESKTKFPEEYDNVSNIIQDAVLKTTAICGESNKENTKKTWCFIYNIGTIFMQTEDSRREAKRLVESNNVADEDEFFASIASLQIVFRNIKGLY